MGAHTFEYQFEGTQSQGKSLFERAAEDDRREYGSGAYSGTIGQKGSFRVLNTKPLLPDEVDDFVRANYDKSGKWDPVACAVTTAAVTGKPRRRTFSVKAKNKAEAIQKAKARVKTKTPQHFKVIKAKTTGTTHSNKVRRKKHGGKVKVKWAWSDDRNRVLYDTPIQAAKAAEEYLAKMAVRSDEYEAKYGSPHMAGAGSAVVFPVAVLEGNDGTVSKHGKKPVAYSVTIGRNDQAATWEVELELRAINPNEIGGWIFFGWASS